MTKCSYRISSGETSLTRGFLLVISTDLSPLKHVGDGVMHAMGISDADTFFTERRLMITAQVYSGISLALQKCIREFH